MKKVAFEDLIVGNYYFVKCGVWRGRVSYLGSCQVGKRIKYEFTFGSFENRRNQIGLCSTKSNIKVYEECL